MTTQTLTVQFHNQTLTAAMIGDIPYVAMKPICENIGLDWASQYSRIKRHPMLNSVIVMITTTGNDGKLYEMLMLPLKYLNGWLFGVDANRVKPEIKERLLDYQRECFDVLAKHFMPDPTPPAWKSSIACKAKATDQPLPKTIQSAINRHAQTLSRRHYDDYHVVLQRKARWMMEVYELQGEDLIEALQQEDLGWVVYAYPDSKTVTESPTKPVNKNSTLTLQLKNLSQLELNFEADDSLCDRWLVTADSGHVKTQQLSGEERILTEAQFIESLGKSGYVVMKKQDLRASLGL